jgi:hypothetical protein
VHEYRIGAKADPWAAAATDDFEISYGNWLNDPDRHIHFPVIWIGKVAESIAELADQNAQNFPLERPSKWRLKG